MSDRSRHLVPLVFMQGFGVACGLVGVRISSSIIEPEVFGLYALLVSTQLVGASVSHRGLEQHVQRNWTRDTSLGAYLELVRSAAGKATVMLAVALLPILGLFALTTQLRLSVGWWAWIFAVNLLVIIPTLVHAALQAEERYWSHAALSVVASVTRSFLPLAFAVAGGATITALGSGFLVHTLTWCAAAALFIAPAWRRVAPEVASLTLGATGSNVAASVSEPTSSPEAMVKTFAAVGIASWLGANGVRWLAPVALDPAMAGYFQLAANLSLFIPSAASLIGLSYSFPAVYAAARDGADDRKLLRMTGRTVRYALILGVIALGALAWIGPRLVGLLIDVRYSLSMDWLFATGCGTLASISAPFYCNALMARHRERACLTLTASSAALRVTAMAAGAVFGGPVGFKTVLIALPFGTVLFESILTRRLLKAGAKS